MAFWDSIAGTLNSVFGIAKTGPKLKNNAGTLEIRNNGDTDFANASADYPTLDDHVATKEYVDDVAGSTSAPKLIRFTLGTATASSTATIPANARIVQAKVEITTQYSVGATLTIGDSSNATRYQATTDNDLVTPSGTIWQKTQDTAAHTSAVAVLATIAGAPAAGAAVVTVWYVETPQV